MSLVITRKALEKFTMTTKHGERITVQFVRYGSGRAKIAVDAPLSVTILREEVEKRNGHGS